MKLLVKKDKLIELLNENNLNITLTEQEQKDIKNYLEEGKNSLKLKDEDHIQKIETLSFLINNPETEDIVINFKNEKLNIENGKNLLLAYFYKNKDTIEINVAEEDNEKVFNLIGEKNILKSEKSSNIKKEKFLINWHKIIESASLDKKVFKKVLLDKINMGKATAFDIAQNDEYEVFKQAALKNENLIFLMKESYLEKFKEDFLNDYNKNSQFFSKVYHYGKNMTLIKENFEKDNYFNSYYLFNFVYKEILDKRTNSVIKKYIELNSDFQNEKNNGIRILSENLELNDKFLNLSLDVYYYVQDILNNREKLLDEKTPAKLLKNFYQDIKPELTEEKEIILKLISEYSQYDYFLNLKFKKEFFEDTEQAVLFWNANKTVCLDNKVFIQSLNKKKSFISFIDKLDFSTNTREDNNQYQKLFNCFTARVKKDKDVIKKLIEKKLYINFLEDYPIEEIDNEIIDTLFDNDFFQILPVSILENEQDITRIIKILESNVKTPQNTYSNYDRRFVFSKKWITQDILLSLTDEAFKTCLSHTINFPYQSFTKNSIEVYKQIVSKDPGLYSDFPEDIIKNEEVFNQLLNKSYDLAKVYCPNEFKSSTRIMKKLIQDDNSWAKEVNPILWKDPDFVLFYIDIIDNLHDTYQKEKALNIVPTEIKELFNSFDITENYVNFLSKYIFENTLKEKKPTKRLKI